MPRRLRPPLDLRLDRAADDQEAILAIGIRGAEGLSIHGDDARAVLARRLGEELLSQAPRAATGGEATSVTLSRPTLAAVPRTTPSITPGFSAGGTHQAQAWTITSVRERKRSTSRPIAAAGTMPKFESAE